MAEDTQERWKARGHSIDDAETGESIALVRIQHRPPSEVEEARIHLIAAAPETAAKVEDQAKEIAALNETEHSLRKMVTNTCDVADEREKLLREALRRGKPLATFLEKASCSDLDFNKLEAWDATKAKIEAHLGTAPDPAKEDDDET